MSSPVSNVLCDSQGLSLGDVEVSEVGERL